MQNIKSKTQGLYFRVQTIAQTTTFSFSFFLKKLKSVLKPQIALPLAAGVHSKKLSVAKHFYMPVVCTTLFFCSCQKENLSNTALNSTTSSSTSADAHRWHRRHHTNGSH